MCGAAVIAGGITCAGTVAIARPAVAIVAVATNTVVVAAIHAATVVVSRRVKFTNL